MTHLVKIGNSQGIRIPKPFIEQACLEGHELTLKVVGEGLLVSVIKSPRHGWKESIEATLKNSGSGDDIDHEWLDADLISDDDLKW